MSARLSFALVLPFVLFVVTGESASAQLIDLCEGGFLDSGQSLGSSSSHGVALADLDGDGDLDAWVANAGIQPNQVWLNQGGAQNGTPGEFVDSGQALGSSDSMYVSLGDLDGDGDVDAWVANLNQANRVWFNDGTGSFVDSGQALGSQASLGVSLGDVDGDGDLDAWVSNVFADANRLWLNSGGLQGGTEGVFVDSGQSLGTHQSYGVVLGDIDNDNDLDAWVVNLNAYNQVWVNQGGAQNGTLGEFLDSGQSPGFGVGLGVSLGDVDNDGDLDAWVVNVNQPDRVWVNQGGAQNGALGVFADSGQSLGSSHSVEVSLADFDGDGDLDAYVATYDNQSDKVWVNQGGAQGGVAGVYAENGQIFESSDSVSVALGDVDGDGDVDAWVAIYGENKVRYWSRDEEIPSISGTPANITQTAAAGLCTAVVTWIEPTAADNCAVETFISSAPSGADFDIGVTTVTYTATDSSGNTATSSFTVTVTDDESPSIATPPDIIQSTDAGLCTTAVTWSDPIAADNCSLASVFTGTGVGVQFTGVSLGLPLGDSANVALGDVDGDGDLDAWVANYSNQPNRVWLNQGGAQGGVSGEYADSGQSLGSSTSTGVALGDVDGDGDLDALVANDNQPDLVWVNQGGDQGGTPGFFVDSGQSLGTLRSMDVSLGDVDGDGDPDALIAYWGGSPDKVWVNQGGDQGGTPGVFVDSGQSLSAAITHGIALGDLDGDGDLDLWVEGYNAPNEVWLNQGGAQGGIQGVFVSSGQSLGGNSATFGVALGDLDDDGDLDVCEATGSNQPNRIWFNAGGAQGGTPGVFLESVQTLGSDSSVQVALGDLDGDGDLDVYLANTANQPNRVWLNAGRAQGGIPGEFIESGQSLGSSSSNAVSLDDVDGDGDVDAWVANFGPANYVWFNDPVLGPINPGATFSVGTTRVTQLVTDNAGNTATASFTVTVTDNENPTITGTPADITQFAAAGLCTAVVTWMEPTAADNCAVETLIGSAASGAEFAIGVTTVTYTATDSSGNTATSSFTVTVTDDESPSIATPPDIIQATDAGLCSAAVTWGDPSTADNCSVASVVSYLDGEILFSSSVTACTPGGLGVALGDLDRDGDLDVWVTDFSGSDFALFNGVIGGPGYYSYGPLSSTGPQSLGTGKSQDVALGDLDGDGDLDALVAKWDGLPNKIWLNSGGSQGGTEGLFFDSGQSLGSQYTYGVALGDLDGDGDLDAVSANWDGANRVWLNQGGAQAGSQGTFVDSGQSLGNFVSYDVALGDVDGDGDLDAWVTNMAAPNRVYLNDGSGSFTDSGQLLGFSDSREVALGDVDGDGDLDAWESCYLDEGRLWLNQGGAQQGSPGLFEDSGQNLGRHSQKVALGDLDGDGDLDAYLARVQQPNKVWLNSGGVQGGTAGVYVDSGLLLGSEDSRGLALGDVDGDGDLDAWVSTFGQCSRVWFNNTTLTPISSGASFALGSTPVTYKVTDTAGNTTTTNFTITVNDTESPAITGTPADIIQSVDAGLCTAVVTWTEPTVSDNCPGASLSSTHAPGETFSVGTTLVTYTAIDGVGNSVDSTFFVTVNDDESPVFTSVPPDINQSNDPGSCGAIVSFDALTASDNCDVQLIVTSLNSGDFFDIGTTTVSCVALDLAGNSQVAYFDVTITDDESPTVVGAPTNIIQGTDPGLCSAIVSWTEPAAADNCLGSSLSSDIAPGSTFGLGTTLVTYTATDTAGRSSSSTFTVTVTDDRPPTISGMPADITLLADPGLCTTAVTWAAPTTTDDCPGVTLASNIAPGASFDVGSTVVTYTSTDGAGNVTTASFTVTVVDEESPVIDGVPDDITLIADPGLCTTTASWSEPTASDNCSVTLTSDFAPGAIFSPGATVVTYTASDGSGNSVSVSFTVTVTDDEVPVIIGSPDDLTFETDAGQCTANTAWVEPIAIDNCTEVTLTSSHTPGVVLPVGTTTVTYLATDATGNTATSSFEISVIDLEAPQILDTPADITLTANADLCTASISWTEPTASDNCSVNLTSNIAPGATFRVGATKITYTATDDFGNEITASFTVTVTDDESPSISGTPGNIVRPADTGLCSTAVTWTAPIAFDNCPGCAVLGVPGEYVDSGQSLGSSWSHGVALGDVDGDGDLDAWVANFSSEPSRLWLNSGGAQGGAPGDFIDSGQLLGSEASRAVALGDVDGDGDLDAWVANANSANRVWLNTGGAQGGTPGEFIDSGQSLGSAYSTSVALGDLDGDGDLDAWVANYDQANRVWLNSGGAQGGTAGAFIDSGTGLGLSASGAVSLGDVDGDGDLDAWVANGAGQPCRVWLNAGGDQGGTPGEYIDSGQSLGTSHSWDVSLGDVDGDGDLDAWVANVNNQPNRLWINAGGAQGGTAGEYIDSGQGLGSSSSLGVSLGDVDADGDLDAWVANASGSNRVWVNLGGSQGGTPGEYADSGQELGSEMSYGISLGDVDGDGDLDAWVANASGQPNRVWTNPCRVGVTLSSDIAPGETFSVGDTLVTYTATDSAGNSVTSSFTVTVTDAENPTINGVPADLTRIADSGLCTTSVTWIEPIATDNCPGVTLTSNIMSGELFTIGSTPVTYTATDSSGNSVAQSFTITVIDSEAPVIAAFPSDITQTADLGLCTASIAWTVPTATDNCPGVSLTSNLAPGSTFSLGSTVVTYTATDSSGNSATASFNVTVTDDEVPVISGVPESITQAADSGLCTTSISWLEPTAADNCPGVTLITDIAPGALFNLGATPVTYTATDSSGHSATASFTVIVIDSEEPQIVNLPTDMTMPADPGLCSTAVFWSPPTGTDNCPGVTLITDVAPGETFQLGQTLVTYTAIDTAGNSTSSAFSVTVIDEEEPVITGVPLGLAFEADAGLCTTETTWLEPTVADNCSGVILTSDHSPGARLPVGTTTVTYTATDTSGNSVIATFDISILDTEDPVISATPADITQVADADQCTTTVTWDDATASDNCSATVSSDFVSGATFGLGSTLVTYTAVDTAGNTTTSSFTVTVIDDEIPSISAMPDDITQSADSGLCTTAVTWIEPLAADNCPSVTLSSDLAPGAIFELGPNPVTYTATDTSGNSVTASFTVFVTDDEAPSIIGAPTDITQSADAGLCTALITWTEPTISDNCPGAVLSSSMEPGAIFNLGTTLVTYTATDLAGNQVNTSFSVTVIDEESPTIIGLPADITLIAEAGLCVATADWVEPTVIDNCPNSVLTSDASSGASFSLGDTLITYTANDASGNSVEATFTVTVIDVEAPSILGMPMNFTQVADAGECNAIVHWTEPTAVDNCSSVSLASDIPSGAIFELGSTVVTYFATDTSGNTITADFTVTVFDAESPKIAGTPAPISRIADFGLCTATITWEEPTATDNCPGVTILPDIPSGSIFPIGSTAVTYTAIDAVGNTATSTFTVTVTDTESPSIINLPGDLVIAAENGTCTSAVTWIEPTATDNCPGATIASSISPGESFSLGTTVVTYTATDGANNITTSSFNVTVIDNEAPSIIGVPAAISLTAESGQCSAIAIWAEPTVSDNCASVTIVSDFVSGTRFSLGTTLVTYTATDGSGNETSTGFTVTITDDEAPVIAGLPALDPPFVATLTRPSDPGECTAAVSWTAGSASDNCGVASLVSTHAPGDLFPVGTTRVIYTATDTSGNISLCEFDVVVEDIQGPEIIGTPSAIIQLTDTGECGAVVSWVEPTISDNCGGSILASSHMPGSFFAVGSTVVTYTATDAGGSAVTASFLVTISDQESPIITGLPRDISQSVDAGTCSTTVTWAEPAVEDNCPGVTVSSDFASGSVFPLGTTSVTYTAIDGQGNISNLSFLVNVTDLEGPVITGLPTELIHSSDAGACSTIITWTEPLASDNCAIASLTSDHSSGDTFPVGATVITYTATDDSGNATSASFTVIVADTEAPRLLGMPDDITVSSSVSCGENPTWVEPSGEDNCGIFALTSTHTPGDFLPVGSTTVTYTVTDLSGLTASESFVITVVDLVSPEIIDLPANLVLGTDTGQCSAVATWTAPTVGDNCGIASVTSTHTPGDAFSLGTTIVTYTAIDLSGNSTIASFTISVSDDEAPVISGIPVDIFVTTSPDDCSTIALWSEPSAIDNCALISLTSDYSSGSEFSFGTTVVTYTGIDAGGNLATASFNVTVIDGTEPVFPEFPGDISVFNDVGLCGAAVIWEEPSALDACGAVTQTSTASPGEVFPLGTTTVSYTATDGIQIVTQTFTVTVIDAEAPSLSEVPTSLAVAAASGACSSPVTWASPTASDNCGVLNLVSNIEPGSEFPIGSTTINYTATDLSGNTTQSSFVVTVLDIEAPIIVGTPVDIIASADNNCFSEVTWVPPTASDLCSGVSIDSTHQPGSIFPIGSTLVVYTATDASGNAATSSFSVTLIDETAPLIVDTPVDQSLFTSSNACSAEASWVEPIVIDACGTTSLTSSHLSGSSFPVGTTTVTYTATDAAGNISVASFDIVVSDNVGPFVSNAPADQLLEAGAGCVAVGTWTPPTFTDACGIASVTQSHSEGDTFPLGHTSITYVATDLSGNTTTLLFSITVEDTTGPTIIGVPDDFLTSADPGTCGWVASWGFVTATDNCDSVTVFSDIGQGEVVPVGSTVVTFTATDGSGNTTIETLSITVIDDEAPTIQNLPDDITVTTVSGLCSGVATWSAPIASDNCDVLNLDSNQNLSSIYPVGTSTVTYTATDVHGNSASFSFDVTVEDNEAPTINGLPDELAFSAEPGLCFGIGTWTVPTVGDNCTISSLTSSHNPGDLFPVGATEVIYTATDDSGNVNSSVLTIVIVDNEAPLISAIPLDITVTTDPGSCSAVVLWTPPVASDNCTVSGVASSHAPGDLFTVGVTTILYTATDGTGNSVTSSFDVNVVDLEAPTITPSGDIFVDPAVGECAASVTVPLPVVGDNCAVAVWTNDFNGQSNASGEYSYGTTVVLWSVIDSAGNVTTVTQTITVGTGSMIDCDGNGVADDCDVLLGNVPDCNENGIPDSCDYDNGVASDDNSNGIMDECEVYFIRSDANADLVVDLGDAVFLLSNLFMGGTSPLCLDAADSNDDSYLDVSDVIFTLGYIFSGGSLPPAPFPSCGLDGTPAAALGCEDSVCP